MNNIMCPWESAKYLIYSSNVPNLLYYSHIPAIIISIILIVFIIKTNKDTLSLLLASVLSLFSLWTFFDLILWATNRVDTTMFFWSLQILIEFLVYIFSFYVSYIFFTNKHISYRNKLFILFVVAILAIIIPTSYTLIGVELSTCYAVENILIIVSSYVFEILFLFGIIVTAVGSYRISVSVEHKKKIIYFAIGIVCFLFAFTYGNLVGSFTDDWVIAQYGLFGMPIFIAFLAYLIVRFKAFNIKMMGAQALVWALVIIIGSEFLFVESLTNQVLVAFTLVISAILGLILVRSVKKEVAQREKIELLATDLKKANSRLTELDIQKSEFVSFATHQLRAPLTAMKGYASLVLEGDTGPVSDEVKNAVTRIFDSSKTLASIVDDYLNITRIELGTMKYAFDNVDMKAMVEDVIAELKPNISASKAKFEFTAQNSGTDYRITADRDKLKQVIANLIDNSIKYTPTGNIKVSLSRDMKNAKLIFEVKDNGIGIAPETLPQLFAKFTRAGNANKTNIKGTGLGLYVAKEIVNSHHGKIYAESEGEGKGSRFVVELDPLSKL